MKKIIAGLFVLFSLPLFAQQDKGGRSGAFSSFEQHKSLQSRLYHDGHGGFVYFPLGAFSFADELVSFKEGNPSAKDRKFRDPKDAIGEPDYDMETETKSLTMGCGGVLTVRFTDNALVDQPGPDLYIFETGSGIEPTSLAISKDGISWVEIGEISGGRADVDLAGKVKPGEIFYYVRLTDLKSSCDNNWPGSDIDAIGAIGSAIQFTLNNSVLFDSGKSDLKPEAMNEIKDIVTKIQGIESYKIEIEGHTDSIGTTEANDKLSLDRANAVKNEFVNNEKVGAEKISVKGYGETMPLVPNSSEANRQMNRRVNIIVTPSSIERKIQDVEKNTIFMSYLRDKDECKNGFPKAINDQNFPGVWTEGIDDALTLNGLIYFFKGSECMVFNIKTNKVEGATQKINYYFPGIWESGIDAVVDWGNGKLYFFKGTEYLRFSRKGMKTDEGYPKQNKGNWGSGSFFDNGIDAAINWGNGYAYFFKGGQYVKYSIEDDSVVNGYPAANTGWGSLWGDRIDGTFDFNSNEVYFFRNPKKK